MFFWISSGYRPSFQCSAVSAFENETFTRNNSYYVTYDKCHMKVFYNDSSQNKITLVKDSTCTEGYQYSLDKYSTYVTEVILNLFRLNQGSTVTLFFYVRTNKILQTWVYQYCVGQKSNNMIINLSIRDSGYISKHISFL